LTYYGAGLAPGLRWKAFRSGWRIAPFIASGHGRLARLKPPLRGLLGAL